MIIPFFTGTIGIFELHNRFDPTLQRIEQRAESVDLWFDARRGLEDQGALAVKQFLDEICLEFSILAL